jgi:hypothetical protein
MNTCKKWGSTSPQISEAQWFLNVQNDFKGRGPKLGIYHLRELICNAF